MAPSVCPPGFSPWVPQPGCCPWAKASPVHTTHPVPGVWPLTGPYNPPTPVLHWPPTRLSEWPPTKIPVAAQVGFAICLPGAHPGRVLAHRQGSVSPGS